MTQLYLWPAVATGKDNNTIELWVLRRISILFCVKLLKIKLHCSMLYYSLKMHWNALKKWLGTGDNRKCMYITCCWYKLERINSNFCFRIMGKSIWTTCILQPIIIMHVFLCKINMSFMLLIENSIMMRGKYVSRDFCIILYVHIYDYMSCPITKPSPNPLSSYLVPGCDR